MSSRGLLVRRPAAPRQDYMILDRAPSRGGGISRPRLYSAAWEGLRAAEQASSQPEPEVSLGHGARDDPVVALEEFQRSWRRRRDEAPWSLGRFDDSDHSSVEWRRYKPPAALRKSPGVTSQIWLEMLPTSIENVRRRIAEEDRRGDEEARTVIDDGGSWQEATACTDKGKKALDATDGASSVAPSAVASSSPCAGKRPKFSISACLFPRAREEVGESSAAGMARKTPRQRLGAKFALLRSSTAETRTGRFMAGLLHEPVECVSCLDEFAPTEAMVKVPCRHSYCPDCFVRLISAALEKEQQWPPKCCLTNIPLKTVVKNTPDDIGRRVQARSSEWDVPVGERVYCWQPKCGAWIEPPELDLANRVARCRRGHATCTICRGSAHGGDDCPQDHELRLTNELATEQGWKHCYLCGALIEHSEACRHMTCLCGAQFCYVCGRVWRTCDCTGEQMYALKKTAERRRAQRLLREQAEARELREMLAQIEARQREEAGMIEAQRLEQQRREEERWRREVEARARRELRRRGEIEAKFEQLRTQLGQLHQLQRAMMKCQQEEERMSMTKDAEAARRLLLLEHEASMSELAVRHGARMKEQEADLEQAFSSAGTPQVIKPEDENGASFRRKKPANYSDLGAAMTAAWQHVDEAFVAWEEWRSTQRESLRRKMQEERAAHKESMNLAQNQMEASMREKEAEWQRRVAADSRWLQEVFLERERLLRRLEIEEMEGDADAILSRP